MCTHFKCNRIVVFRSRITNLLNAVLFKCIKGRRSERRKQEKEEEKTKGKREDKGEEKRKKRKERRREEIGKEME